MDRLIPAIKRTRSPSFMNLPNEYGAVSNEISSGVETLANINSNHHEHRRAVSLDQTSFAAQSPSESSSGLSANEDLWLPSVQSQSSSTTCNPELYPIHVVEEHVSNGSAEFDPIHVAHDAQHGHAFSVVPPSPPTHACIASADVQSFYEFYPRAVPLVEPGASITEWEFQEAVYGIDFSKVFD